jgi:hypothetical protein
MREVSKRIFMLDVSGHVFQTALSMFVQRSSHVANGRARSAEEIWPQTHSDPKRRALKDRLRAWGKREDAKEERFSG